MKARYQHNCDKCQFLGSITYPGPLLDGSAPLRNADLYYCKDSITLEGGTVIARFSSTGSDYSSSPVKIVKQHFFKRAEEGWYSTSAPALIAAYYFADAKGLLK